MAQTLKVPLTIRDVVRLANAYAADPDIPYRLSGNAVHIAILIVEGAKLGLSPETSLRQMIIVDGQGMMRGSLETFRGLDDVSSHIRKHRLYRTLDDLINTEPEWMSGFNPQTGEIK